MRHGFLGLMATTAACFIAVQTASAADMQLKALPAPMPMPVDTWSGFYLGANVGYSAGRVHYTNSNSFIAGGNAGTTDSSSSIRSVNGIIGGGQIGWNWQVGQTWLWGIETDFQGSDQKGSNAATNQTITAGVLQTAVQQSDLKLDWFGTARVRTGFIMGNTVLYGTGGLAYGRMEVSESTSRTPGVVGSAAFAGAGSTTSTRTGFAVGAGTETKLVGNWSAKLEYLFVDLGKVSNPFNLLFTSGANNGTVLSNFVSTSRFQDHIFRAGINYQLH